MKAAVALVAAAALCATQRAEGAPREIEVGLENYYYPVAETPLNRGDVLGLGDYEDLLRGAVAWRESQGAFRAVYRGYVEHDFGSAPDTTWTTRQAYLQYGWGSVFQVRLGKQRVAWGSGFAWNPTNRIEPPKSPFNTGLEQEGSLAARVDWIPSSRVGLILVAARSETDTTSLGLVAEAPRRTSGSGRLRVLFKDTDLALVVTAGENQRTLVGLDAARDVAGQVTAHAEAAVYRGAEMAPPRDDQTFFRIATGLLRSRNTTSLSLEYFFNGEGYSDAAASAYLAALDLAYGRATNPALPQDAREAALDAYLKGVSVPYSGGLGLRRHYLQAAWSRSEIRGQWSLAARGVLGLSDGGVALTPGVGYAPRGNVTLQLDAVVLLGKSDSEYRLAPVKGSLQTRVKVLF